MDQSPIDKMDQSPEDIGRHGGNSDSIGLDDSATQTNGTRESLLASSPNDQYLGALKIDLAAGLSDIRSKVEEEHKEFLELVAKDQIFKMQPSQEFAYNMMRGKGLGTRPVFPPPRAPLGVEEDYRPVEDLEDNLQSGFKYYKIAPDSDSMPAAAPAAAPEELAEGINRLAIEERPRCEVVLDHKGDEGETNNHYKGKEVWGNFGYLSVNGSWVDPDSEKDLAHAFRGYPTLLPEELEGAREKDARIMSADEQEEFYEFFNDYVSDDEGDPRDNRLSPEEFQKLVRGTASEGKGDTWVKAIVALQEKFTDRPREPRNHKKKSANDMMLPPQIDRDTGSFFSGYGGSNSDTASLLLSADGVDILQRPETFNRMDPQTDQNILAKAYADGLDAFKTDGGWSGTTLPVYKSKDVARAIHWDIPGLTDEQLEAGVAELTRMGEAHFQHAQDMKTHRDQVKSEKIYAESALAGCMKELLFINRFLTNNPSQANIEALRLADSINLEETFKLIERSTITKEAPNPTSNPTADPYLGIDPKDRVFLRSMNEIYQGTNNITLHLQDQIAAYSRTKAGYETKIGEYYSLRQQIMAVTGMTNEFIERLIPVSAPRAPRVNF